MNTNPLKTIFTNILSMKGAKAMNHNSFTRMVAKGLRLLFAAALMAGLALTVGPVRVAHAATFVVTRFDDPMPDGCQIGDCSLREAIRAANNTVAADIIRLDPGTYILDLAGMDNQAAMGDLDITRDLTIEVSGGGSAVIDASGLKDEGMPDRVFDVDPDLNGITVTISNVTVQKGEVPIGEENRGGGGILNNRSSTLTLTNVAIQSNKARSIGVTFGGGIANLGTLTLNSSSVSGNEADVGGGFYVRSGSLTLDNGAVRNNTALIGGGIYNFQGTLTVAGGSIVGNRANDIVSGGGGIFNEGSGADVTLSNVSITSNGAAADGGGIFNSLGTLRVINSRVGANAVGNDDDGGGIFNSLGTLEVTNSLVLGNEAGDNGGGIANNGGTLEVSNSTIAGNTAEMSGAGIFNAQGMLEMTNSTVSSNEAADDGGGIYNIATILLNNVTLTNNTADDDIDGTGDGGGVYNVAGGVVNFANTILAGNRNLSGDAPDCSGSLTSQGYNLIQDITNCTIGGDTMGNRIGDDPLLGPLADNGGPTLTHSLLANSPAINRGNPVPPGSAANACSSIDQRLFPRVGRCDIGAYEDGATRTDTFSFIEHPDGSLGGNWSGETAPEDYQVIVRSLDGGLGRQISSRSDVSLADQQASDDGLLDVEAGGPIYWAREAFGPDQQAFITLVRIDPNGQHHSVLLKVQNDSQLRPNWRRGAIAVFYNTVDGNKVGIEAFVPRRGWHTLAVFPMTLRDGDQLGGRALPDGRVQAYVNGRLVGTTGPDPFFANKGGRAGLWFFVTADSLLDDFSAATVAP